MRIFVVLCTLLVFGCSTPPASVSVAETAKESISALTKALPKECQTDSVKNHIAALSKMVEVQLKVCETEKRVLEEEKTKRDLIITVLAGIIIGYMGLKVFKKF